MQTVPPATPDWRNLNVLARRLEPPRAERFPYADEASARAGDPGRSAYVRRLSGAWRFRYAEHPDDAPDGFARPDFDDADWDAIPVPSNWQLHGYGRPHYTSCPYPFLIDPPDVPDTPVGCYRTAFTVPDGWAGRDVRLLFGGVDSAFHVWVNGKPAGYAQGSHYASEFRISEFLAPGDNVLAVKVYQWSVGSYLESQDKWRMSGIFRDVWLIAEPGEMHIRDIAVTTAFPDGYGESLLGVRVHLSGKAGRTARLRIRLLDEQRREVLQAECARTLEADDGDTIAEFVETVRSPRLWTAETPNLYRLLVALTDEDGRVLEVKGANVGFRDIRVENGLFLVNGRPVKLKGVNRNEFDPKLGFVTTPESMRRDIELMKRHNLNAVRLSHYPNDIRWLDLCDRYGLYVIDEADLETHGFHFAGDESFLSNHPDWTAAYLQRATRMVEQDKNHPCIIMWSLGNESGCGRNHDAMADWIRQADPTRPIHYERAYDAPIADVVSRMYPSVDLLIEEGKKPDPRPFLMVEYGHAMGNAVGNLKEYWDAVYASPRLLGGLIWEWADQGIERTAPDGTACYAYGGDFGEEPHSGSFCLDGLLFPDRTVKAGILELKKIIEPVHAAAFDPETGRLTVRNRYDFRTLEHLDGGWTLYRDGEPVRSGRLPRLKTPPGGEETVRIPYADGPLAGPGEYWVHVRFTLREEELWAPAGHEVAWADLPVAAASADPKAGAAAAGGRPKSAPATAGGGHARTAAAAEADGPAKPLVLVREGRHFGIAGESADGPFTLRFDARGGAAEAWLSRGVPLITAGPKINLWRAPIDNDVHLKKQWMAAGYHRLTTQPKRVAAEMAGDGEVRIETESLLGARGHPPAFRTKLVCRIRPDGAAVVEAELVPCREDLPPLPRFGIELRMPGRFDRFAWFGRGPHECYADRKESGKLGIYAGTVQDQFVPYIRPQENGNKADVRWAEVTDAEGYGLRFAGDRPLNVSAHHYSTEDMTASSHVHLLTRLNETIVKIDAAQSGIGNHSCGDAPLLEAYKIKAEALRFSVAIRPVHPDRPRTR